MAIGKNKVYAFLAYMLIMLVACGGGGGGGIPSESIGNENPMPIADNDNYDNADTPSLPNGSITLTWDAPITNSDGTSLSDLAGYKIYFGTSTGNYSVAIDIENVTTYTFNDLPSGIYYFAVVAYDTSGNESTFSNEVSATIA